MYMSVGVEFGLILAQVGDIVAGVGEIVAEIVTVVEVGTIGTRSSLLNKVLESKSFPFSKILSALLMHLKASTRTFIHDIVRRHLVTPYYLSCYNLPSALGALLLSGWKRKAFLRNAFLISFSEASIVTPNS